MLICKGMEITTITLKPTVTKATIRKKIQEGIYSNDWKIVGLGGSYEKMMAPLLDYLKSKGIKVT